MYLQLTYNFKFKSKRNNLDISLISDIEIKIENVFRFQALILIWRYYDFIMKFQQHYILKVLFSSKCYDQNFIILSYYTADFGIW